MASARLLIFALLAFTLGITDALADCRRYLAHALDKPGYFFSQNDPELMRVYANADALCGPACIGNAFRLADLVSPSSRGKSPFGLLELRRFTNSVGPIRQLLDEGTGGFELANALGGFSKEAQSAFDVDLISTYPLGGSPKKLRARAPWITLKAKRKILPSLITDPDYDFFIIGYTSLDRGRRVAVGHFTIGVYDPDLGKIKILDPTHPDGFLYYSIEKRPGSDGSLRLSRRYWDEKTGSEKTREYLADELFGFRLKRRPAPVGHYRAAAHNPLLDPNHSLAQIFAPFLLCSCTRQGSIPVCYRGASQLTLEEVYAMKSKAKSIFSRLTPHESIPDAFVVDGKKEWVVDAADVDELVAAADRI